MKLNMYICYILHATCVMTNKMNDKMNLNLICCLEQGMCNCNKDIVKNSQQNKTKLKQIF